MSKTNTATVVAPNLPKLTSLTREAGYISIGCVKHKDKPVNLNIKYYKEKTGATQAKEFYRP
jgi:hypothetical protein